MDLDICAGQIVVCVYVNMKGKRFQLKSIRLGSLRNCWFMLKQVWKYTPLYLLVVGAQALLSALWTIISGLFYVKFLFDTIEKGEGFRRIIVVSCFVICLKIVQVLFDKVADTVLKPRLNCTLHERMQGEIYDKARQLDIACYDNPKYYEDFVWAMREADTRAIKTATDVINFFARMLTLVSMVTILLTIDPLIIVAIIASLVMNMVINIRMNQTRKKKSLDYQQKKRVTDYYQRVFTLPEYAMELRDGETSQLIRSMYQQAKQDEMDCVARHAPKIFLWTFVSQLMTGFLIDAVMTGYLILRYALDATFTLGSFSAGINSVWKVFTQSSAVTQHIAKLNEDHIYAEKFMEFLSLASSNQATNSPTNKVDDFQNIVFDHVSFSYHATEEATMALKNISLTITKGEKIAIVGYNGAGKTTLVNLLLGLYEPTQGHVLYNGQDLSSYDIREYRSLLGAVCQDHKLFATSIAENIIGGPYTAGSEQQIADVIDRVSLRKRISELPNGIHTMLTREFDGAGTNLSGGEIQKVALAHVLYQSPEMVVLDEPSSALDPNAEQDLNDIIDQTTKEKTLVIISHRLSCVHSDDRIYMMKEGEIIEEGTHTQLMNLQGLYYEMYNEQATRKRFPAS